MFYTAAWFQCVRCRVPCTVVDGGESETTSWILRWKSLQEGCFYFAGVESFLRKAVRKRRRLVARRKARKEKLLTSFGVGIVLDDWNEWIYLQRHPLPIGNTDNRIKWGLMHSFLDVFYSIN